MALKKNLKFPITPSGHGLDAAHNSALTLIDFSGVQTYDGKHA
jgi:hypothetical protein